MKKLAIVTTHPIQYNAPLFELLTKRGVVKVKVFYTWGEDVLKDKFDPGFGKYVQWDIPLLQGYDYTFVENVSGNKGSHHFKGIDNPTLVKEIADWGADAVLVYGWSFKSHLKAMRYFKGRIPVLFRGDSVSLQSGRSIKAFARKQFLKWVYKLVDKALYVGEHNKNYFLQNGLKPSQLVFAPHAVDNDRFWQHSLNAAEAIRNWRQQLGIAADDIVFLYAGKLDANKNVGLLAEAFKKMGDTNSHLVIAGGGEKAGELQASYGSQQNIHFLPFQNQSEMPALYGLCDVYVLPSFKETWGLAMNEAMACGKAIVASNTCGAAIDLVHNTMNGYVFPCNNLAALTERLKSLCRDKAVLVEMGQQSRRLIEQWNFTVVCSVIEEALQQIELNKKQSSAA